MHFPSPINNNFNYFGKPNHQGIAEAYLRDIYRNVHIKKFSFLATVTGRHRTGKSVSAVALGDLLDPTFYENLEERVVYTPYDFSIAIQNIANSKPKTIGGVVVWDEANLGLSSRDWYTQANKHINFTVQAFGYIRPIVLFVTQDVTFIDSQPRKLFHAFMEVNRTNNQYCNIRPFFVSINKRSGKMFYSYPRMKMGRNRGGGRILKMKPLRLLEPPKNLMDRYEKHSIKRKSTLMRENAEVIQHMRDKAREDGKQEYLSDDEIIDHCIAEKNNPVFINTKGEFEANTIAQEFHVSYRKAQYLKARADTQLQILKEEGLDNDTS